MYKRQVEKKERLHEESGKIVAKNLAHNLNLELTQEEAALFNNWRNPLEGLSRQEKNGSYQRLEKVLRKIYAANKKIGYYDDQCLLNVIGTKWRWIKFYRPLNKIEKVDNLDAIFKEKTKV